MMLSTLLKKRSIPFARTRLRHHSTAPGPNEELIQLLTRYMEEEKASASSNAFKVRAYSKAISAIGQLPEQVRSVDQVKDLRGIGTGISQRIDAYLCGTPYEPPTSSKPRKARDSDHSLEERTGTKSQKTLDELRKQQVVSSLSSINGVGKVKANALYAAGCRSLQDLRDPTFFQMLSHSQQISAQYMIGRDRHVTHEQALAIRDLITQNISSNFTLLLAGDFRRGATSAQHVTFVVPHPRTTLIFPPEGSPSDDSTIKLRGKAPYIRTPFAGHGETKVKPKGLQDTGFSTEILSPLELRGVLAATSAVGAQRWNGIIRIPDHSEEGNGRESRAERIRGVQDGHGQFLNAEICCVPEQCVAGALIALTGDHKFNIAIRTAASRLGLRLNEYGLWQWRSMAATVSVGDIQRQRSIEQYGGYWELVAGEREEDIFEAVGMEWVPPERRNFANLDTRRKKE